jgi:hypothetical protein
MSSAAAAVHARDAARALGFDLGEGADSGGSGVSTTSGEPDTLVASLLFPPGTPRDAVAACAAEFVGWADAVVPGYVWSGDALALRQVEPGTPRGRQLGLRPHSPSAAAGGAAVDAPALQARLHYGDAPGDEWYALWLLAAFTASTASPTSGGSLAAVLHAVDGDGEVFAIETADALPRWCTPPVATRRFYVAAGRLHLIPRGATSPGGLGAVASPVAGAAHVRAHAAATLAPPRMQAALAQRLHAFPAAAAESVHVARVVLPVAAARLLAAEPALVGPAVAAFAGRDPAEVQAAARMRHFPPGSGFAPASLRLSRPLVVQLLSTSYHPPAALGRRAAAAAAAGSAAAAAADAPASADGAAPAPALLPATALPPPGSAGYRPWDLGLKLVAGLEILLARGGAPVAALLLQPAMPSSAVAASDVTATAASAEGEAAWHHFAAALVRRGFYEGCRSVAEREARTARARAYFSATTGGGGNNDDDATAAAGSDAALLDAAAADAADGAPAATAGHRRDGEPAAMRAARALLAVSATGNGYGQPAQLPPADRDDSLAWLDDLTADDDDDPAAWAAREAADRARLAAESATMLRRLRLEPVPPIGNTGADGAPVTTSLHASDDASGGDGSDDESAGDSDGSDGSDSDEDEDESADDGDDGDDGALVDETTPEGKQLSQLLASLTSFMRGASGLDGVEAVPATGGGASAGSGTGAGQPPVPASTATAAGASAAAPPPTAPGVKAGRRIDVTEFTALLAAHRAASIGDAPISAAAPQSLLPSAGEDSDDGNDALLPSGGDDSGDDDGGALPASRRRVRFGGDARTAVSSATAEPEPEPEPSLRDMMAALDDALLSSEGTTLGASFATLAGAARDPNAAMPADGSGGLSAADVRYNLLSSLAASVGASSAVPGAVSADGVPASATGGGGASATAGPGPAANLLAALGVAPPRAWWRGGDGGGDDAPAAKQTEGEDGGSGCS